MRLISAVQHSFPTRRSSDLCTLYNLNLVKKLTDDLIKLKIVVQRDDAVYSVVARGLKSSGLSGLTSGDHELWVLWLNEWIIF